MSDASTIDSDIQSLAESKFWRDWANQAPRLLRDGVDETKFVPAPNALKSCGIGLGAVLAMATLTPIVPKELKWLTGSGAVAAAVIGYGAGVRQQKELKHYRDLFKSAAEAVEDFADELARDTGLKADLAEYLSENVTAEDIQRKGIEGAVSQKTAEFGKESRYLSSDTILSRLASGSKDAPLETSR